MREIVKGNTRFAISFDESDLGEGLRFFSKDDDFIQVGSWNYAQGKELKAHNHNIVPRSINRTQEFIFVLTGAAEASIYDEKNELIETIVLKSHCGLILLAGGHGYKILENNTKVIETKNGPYLGAKADRRRIF